jgi:hypothetical protein
MLGAAGPPMAKLCTFARVARLQAKKKPRPKTRQFIREETPRKGRGVSDASHFEI